MQNNPDFIKFQRRLTRTFQLLFVMVASQIQEQLKAEEREFPNQTIRRYGRGTTGKIADSPRDVIDSGGLYNSFDFKFTAGFNSAVAEYSYNKDYAATIYYGYISTRGYRIVPYPWIEKAIAKLDIELLFKQIWNITK